MLKLKPTIERLRNLFDERDGVLYWRQKSGPRSPVNPGDKAGRVNDKGYVTVGVDGVELKGHIIVWALHNGAYPESMLDHKNRVKSDNRIANLRTANHADNNANRQSATGKTSTHLGVSWKKQIGAWRATIIRNNRQSFLGHFASEVDAAAAYNRAATEHHGQFANPNQIQ